MLPLRILRKSLLPLLTCLSLTACAEDLRNEDQTEADAGNLDLPGAADASPSSHITSSENGDGTTTSIIDATSNDAWIYLDLNTGLETTPTTPLASEEWDLAFRRFDVTLNGGISGASDVAVMVLPNQDFDSLTIAPASGYTTDLADGDDEGEEPDLYFGSEQGAWYDYDPTTHVLSPKERVYVVASAAGTYYKLRFLGYYDDAGTAGTLRLQWGPIAAPSNVQRLTVDASATDAWVYLELENGTVLDIGSPEVDTSWDLAVRRTGFRTNGGTSGSGVGGAIEVENTNIEDVVEAPASGYTLDALLPIPGPPGSGEESANPSLATWYDYNPTTHVISPRTTSFVIRTSEGEFSRLQIFSYDSGAYEIDWSFAGAGLREF